MYTVLRNKRVKCITADRVTYRHAFSIVRATASSDWWLPMATRPASHVCPLCTWQHPAYTWLAFKSTHQSTKYTTSIYGSSYQLPFKGSQVSPIECHYPDMPHICQHSNNTPIWSCTPAYVWMHYGPLGHTCLTLRCLANSIIHICTYLGSLKVILGSKMVTSSVWLIVKIVQWNWKDPFGELLLKLHG